MHDRLLSSADSVSRRRFLQYTGAAGLAVGLESLLPSYARALPLHHTAQALEPRMVDDLAVYKLEIAEMPIAISGRRGIATTIN